MNLTELNRQLENLIRIGTIAVVDHATQKLKVKSGELLTNWLDWPAEIGRNYKRWRPLRLNTQVIICCPAGDPAQAMIIGTLYSNDFKPPTTNPDIDVVQFDSGSLIKHDANTGDLTLISANNINLEATNKISLKGGHIEIESDNNITSRADLHRIHGPMKSTGGDHCCDGVSHKNHFHFDIHGTKTEPPVRTC
jgi:phage baseplate assembly protein V